MVLGLRRVMESALHAALLLGLFLVPCCHAQAGGTSGTTTGSKTLEPWLVGLSAVTGFLFVMFVATLINRFFCSKKATEETPESDHQLRTAQNVYDNIAMELEEGSSKVAELKVEDEKQTNM